MGLSNRLDRLERLEAAAPSGCPACVGVMLCRIVWPLDAPDPARRGHISGGPCSACGRPPDHEIEIVYVDGDRWRSLGGSPEE
jgi:hypothetical protein